MSTMTAHMVGPISSGTHQGYIHHAGMKQWESSLAGDQYVYK
jgi:hypothetical protein